MSIGLLLSIIFMVLKLTGHLDWHWGIVFLPVIIDFTLSLWCIVPSSGGAKMYMKALRTICGSARWRSQHIFRPPHGLNCCTRLMPASSHHRIGDTLAKKCSQPVTLVVMT